MVQLSRTQLLPTFLLCHLQLVCSLPLKSQGSCIRSGCHIQTWQCPASSLVSFRMIAFPEGSQRTCITISSLNQLLAKRVAPPIFVETSGFQPWLCFRITWKLLKISCAQPSHPTPNQNSASGL